MAMVLGADVLQDSGLIVVFLLVLIILAIVFLIRHL
jgi:hypothetical protein